MESMFEDLRFDIMYGPINSYKQSDNICTVVTNCLCAQLSTILVLMEMESDRWLHNAVRSQIPFTL